MKRGAILFLGIILILSIISPSLIMAQEESNADEPVLISSVEEEEINTGEQENEIYEAITDLPDSGILPTSPWYGFKTAFQNIRLTFLRREAKERYRLRLMEIRLAELKKLQELTESLNASGKNTEKMEARIEKLTERYERQLEISEEQIEKLKALGRNVTELREHVANMTYKHILVLQRVSETVPAKARIAILKTINRSVTGHEKAVASVLKERGLTGDEVDDILEEARERYRERVRNRTEAQACAQVIIQAYDPGTKECKVFASPCDVPEGWVRGSCRVNALKADVAAIRQDVKAYRSEISAARREALITSLESIRERLRERTETEAEGEEEGETTNLAIKESTKNSAGVAQQSSNP